MTDLVQAAEQIAQASVVLFDWDGCLSSGGALLPGARELLIALESRAYVLSNNSTHRPRDLQALLARSGVPIPADQILLAGHHTLEREAVASAGQAVHLVAHPQMAAYAASLGVRLTPGLADRVVVLRDPTFTFVKLEAVANAVRRCGQVVLSNPDLVHPGLDGDVVPETGALYAAIAACLQDVDISLEVVGKPSPILFQAALERADVDPASAVMVGDNPATDGAGAQACGVPFVLVAHDGPGSLATLSPLVLQALPYAARQAAVR